MKLPWTKREIVDTVIAEYKPFNLDDHSTYPFFICMRVFMRLALGRPEGRAPPYVEHALFQRIERVRIALRKGRDPDAEYEIPLDGEQPLNADVQLEPSYRKLQEMLDETDRELKAARRGL